MPNTNRDASFEPVDVTDVPLEELRMVVAALAANAGVQLQRREVFFGEPEYRFVHK